jgi:SAM-dependent methyltransferase
VSAREQFLRRFHALHAGATAKALVRTGSYQRLADRVLPAYRILDLACGSEPLGAAFGLDLSLDELLATRSSRVVQGRAQELPYRNEVFDACICHLGFMLFDAVDDVVAELFRVLQPGAQFVAVLGGGPTASDGDAFHRFLEIAADDMEPVALGDPRAKSEAGWRSLFQGWDDVTFDREELDLGGTFDEVWQFLGASYQLSPDAAPRIQDKLRAEYADSRVECKVVTFVASARRPMKMPRRRSTTRVPIARQG